VDLSPPSRFGRLQFYEVCEPVDYVAVHPVHETVDIFHRIFNRKIIPLKPVIPSHDNFATTPLNFIEIMF
jgi:hypothetical protein